MESIPNIFLDSNIFHSDPFQKNRFNSALINLANSSQINLFITDVVYLESINNFKELISEKLGVFNKALTSLNNLTDLDHKFEVKSAIEYINEFKSYLDSLTSSVIQVITFNPDDISEVVSRSISQTKPFSKNKQEFRDCIIWLTIKRFITENNLIDCYLLSANTKDFYDDAGVNLHPILKDDIPNLILCKSAKELILKVENLNKFIVEEELNIWSYLNITEDVIKKIMLEDINKELTYRIEFEIKNKYEEELLKNVKIDKIQISFFENIVIKSKAYKVIQDFSFFSCHFELELPTLFSNFEELIGDYISEEYVLQVSGKVHFTIRPNEQAQFNDIDEIEINV